MNTSKIVKLSVLNLLLVITNIVLLSEGLVGLSIFSPNLIVKLSTIVLFIVDILIFVFGNYIILNYKPKQKPYNESKLVETKDFINMLNQCRQKKEFKEEVDDAIQQIARITTKTETLNFVLSQHFTPGSMTYTKFSNTINGINQLFFANLKSMIGRMLIFSQEEYDDKDNVKANAEAKFIRNKIFKEHIEYVEGIVEKNENILIKLDNLVLEISKLDDTSSIDLNDLSTVQEINSLIEQTKFYKQN
jgi:hypothetical protein